MSLTAPTLDAEPTDPAPATRSRRALLACAGLACALAIASGTVRAWQVRRVEDALRLHRESPFPLESLPMTVGNWVGEKTELDPDIVARTGSNDLVTRRYVNQTTGVALDVIVLHGPASDIFIHSPDFCYPRAGYTQMGDLGERPVSTPAGPVAFRTAAFTRGDPAHPDTQEVYYSWRYNGRWTTEVRRPREMERVSGMYKVQVARRLQPNEARSVDNPCEAFLEALLPALEARIAEHSSPPQAAPRS
jgi:hypothetical protein